MASDFHRRVERALARHPAAEGRTRQVEVPARVFDGAAREMTCASLTIDELAEAIASAIKISERRVVEHVGRLVRLIDVKLGDATHEKTRITNLHRRVTAIESDLRRMARKN